MKLITVTLNPAIDVTLMCDQIDFDKVGRVHTEIREAGGKGVNVSRVAKKFGADGYCFALMGKENTPEYLNLLNDTAGEFISTEIDGRIRENLTIRSDEKCVKLNRMGAVASEDDLNTLFESIKKVLCANDLVAVSGSIPQGISEDMLTDFCLKIKDAGGKILLDTESIGIENIKKIKPFVIKPNLHEFAKLIGVAILSPTKINEEMQNLYNAGVENILLTMGDKGMKALCQGEIFDVGGVKVDVKSNVCAGDSTLAGFAIGNIRKMDIADCVKLSSACGTATVMCEGSGVCDEASAMEIMEKISLKKG
ncbi:MAG: hexose kinase [Clostridia bacterium]|nr:hexose kinase [Clostridia bacterium]